MLNEIEKMYENAGVLKECLSPCYINKTWRKAHDCPNCDNRENYPPFTAEKQLELIKWLGKLDGKLEITCTYNKEKFIFNFYFNRKTDKNPDPKYPYSNFLNADIEILIASIINDIWQDLTEEEKQQVKGILE